MREKKNNLLRSTLFDGLLLIVLGVVMLIWPLESLGFLCVVIGAVLVLMGLIRLILFGRKEKDERRVRDIPIGLLQIAGGIALIIRPDFFITVFQYVTGVLILYGAVLMFAQAVRLRREKGALFAASLAFACVTTLLAVIILVNPAAFASFMTQLHGVALIAEGLAMIIVLRKSRKTD